jgi:hypothetical protein
MPPTSRQATFFAPAVHPIAYTAGMRSQPFLQQAYRRKHTWVVLALVATVVLGLWSRKAPLFPALLENYPGDALWAVVVYLCVALIRPAISPQRVAGVALVLSFLVECFQLYQAPWIVAVRATTAGHLVLGNGFDRLDLVAYVVGIGLAWALDCARAYGKSRHA